MQTSAVFVSCVYAIKVTNNLSCQVYKILRFFHVSHAKCPTIMGVALCSLSLKRKSPWCPLNRMLGRPLIRSGVCGLEHNKRLLLGFEKRSFDRPHRRIFPILTELHRHPLMKVNNCGILIQKRWILKKIIFAPVVCRALWRLFRSTLSREGRLQHQSKFPEFAVHGDATGYVESVTKWLKLLLKVCALLLKEGH
jgi:hypothetical protein